MRNPIAQFKKALKRAERKGFPFPNAMALGTASQSGTPSLRMMLLKGADSRGFVFYTNLRSQKGRELLRNPNAALCFWWPALEEQIRIEGKTKRVSAKEADRYFTTRPRGSQIGAWASRQSSALESRGALLAEFQEYEKKFKGKKVPRPSYWSGFILVPKRIEFWHGMPDRLHDRTIFIRRGKSWTRTKLYP